MRSMNRILLVPLATTLALLGAGSASAADPVTVTKHFCGFESEDFGDASGQLHLNPDATSDSGGILLTAASAQQTGTAFYFDALKLMDQVDGQDTYKELHVYFNAVIDSPPGGGGHGFTFMLQNSSPYAVGANLDGLGFGGIKPSVIFEFDTTTDEAPSGVEPPYLAMILDGDQDIHHSVAMGTTINPESIHAWIDYDPVEHFKIYVSDTKTKPKDPVQWSTETGDYPEDLDLDAQLKVLDSVQAFLGFSAATGITGDKSSAHRILAWEFSNKAVPCDCQGDSACAYIEATPVCSLAQKGKPGGEVICVECTKNEHCKTAESPVCHSMLEVCVECETDTDCPAARPVCDPDSHTCGCTKDEDCPAARPHCDLTDGPPKQGSCQECLEDDHCSILAPVCDTADTFVNVCICVTAQDCTEEARPICDASTVDCRKCETNEECEARDPEKPYCELTGADEGKCVPTPTCGPDDACDCATLQCCSEDDIEECNGAQIVGGGCACSTPGGSGSTAALSLAAALAALAAFVSRSRRR